jgi:hypothetical protein
MSIEEQRYRLGLRLIRLEQLELLHHWSMRGLLCEW